MNKKNKTIIFAFILFVIAFIFLILYQTYFIGNFKYSEYIKSNFEQKQKKNIEKIQYLKRQRCSYSYISSAALPKSDYIKNCYVYYYDIYFKDSNQSKAYIIEKDGNITFYDETIYISIDELINKYKEKLNIIEIKHEYAYISSIWEENTGDIYNDISEVLSKKNITLKVNDTLDSQYINNFLELNNKLKQYIKSNNDLKEIYIYVSFNNGNFSTYIYDDNNKKQDIRFEIGNDYNIIGLPADKEEIEWCISNNKSSYDYRKEISENKFSNE